MGIGMIVRNPINTDSILEGHTEKRASDGDNGVVMVVMMPVLQNC